MSSFLLNNDDNIDQVILWCKLNGVDFDMRSMWPGPYIVFSLNTTDDEVNSMFMMKFLKNSKPSWLPTWH